MSSVIHGLCTNLMIPDYIMAELNLTTQHVTGVCECVLWVMYIYVCTHSIWWLPLYKQGPNGVHSCPFVQHCVRLLLPWKDREILNETMWHISWSFKNLLTLARGPCFLGLSDSPFGGVLWVGSFCTCDFATSAAVAGKTWEGAGKVPLQGCEFYWKALVIFCKESVSVLVWRKLVPMGSGVSIQGP